MNLLTNILHWISTAMLIPVIVLLLMAFIKSLLMVGGFYGLYINRLKFNRNMMEISSILKNGEIKDIDFENKLTGNRLFLSYLKKMMVDKWHPIHCEKSISDFEIETEKELEKSKVLVRTGPILGLMGTLIPMGPALVGLAAGDIATMAQNMQVAFSTTVIGIFISAVGFVIQLIKQRWFVDDLNNLNYIYELANNNVEKKIQ